MVVPWGCDFKGCDFKGCDLKGCDFKGCDFKGCDFVFLNTFKWSHQFQKTLKQSIEAYIFK